MARLRNPTPWDIIMEEFMQPLNMTVNQVAKATNIPRDILLDILGAEIPMNQDIAEKLGKFFWCSTEMFLWLQKEYEKFEAIEKLRINTIHQIQQDIQETEQLLSEYLGWDVHLWLTLSEDCTNEEFENVCKKITQAFEKVTHAIEQKQEYTKRKDRFQNLVNEYHSSYSNLFHSPLFT